MTEKERRAEDARRAAGVREVTEGFGGGPPPAPGTTRGPAPPPPLSGGEAMSLCEPRS